jgi:hypothetical protein
VSRRTLRIGTSGLVLAVLGLFLVGLATAREALGDYHYEVSFVNDAPASLPGELDGAHKTGVYYSCDEDNAVLRPYCDVGAPPQRRL